MISPAVPITEYERLEALDSYQVLDTFPEEEYDAITKLASEICGTPISLITLIDEKRQWFKSKQGMADAETPREHAFCAHGILNPTEPLIVNNSYEDPRFEDNPLVTGDPKVEFYAGIPLLTEDGHALGSLCVIDNVPRTLSDSKIESLQILAKQVVNLLELRKRVNELKETKLELEQSLDSLNDFAHIVAHDIKAPVRSMGQLAQVIQEDYAEVIDSEGRKVLNMLSESAVDAGEYIDGVLKYSQATNISQLKREEIDLNDFFTQILRTLQIPDHIKIEVDLDLPSLKVAKIALQQISTNLLTNAIKYNDKEEGHILISAVADGEGMLHISIKDNGRGIPKELVERIFAIFYMVDKKDAKAKGSSGIGLSIVKKIVTKLNGVISLSSQEGIGSTFTVSIPKK